MQEQFIELQEVPVVLDLLELEDLDGTSLGFDLAKNTQLPEPVIISIKDQLILKGYDPVIVSSTHGLFYTMGTEIDYYYMDNGSNTNQKISGNLTENTTVWGSTAVQTYLMWLLQKSCIENELYPTCIEENASPYIPKPSETLFPPPELISATDSGYVLLTLIRMYPAATEKKVASIVTNLGLIFSTYGIVGVDILLNQQIVEVALINLTKGSVEWHTVDVVRSGPTNSLKSSNIKILEANFSQLPRK